MSLPRLHLPGRAWSRREFLLAGGAAAAAWPLLTGPSSAIAQKGVKLSSYPFTLGVASGDPAPDGFVLWTRLAPKPLEGGGMPPENVIVDWKVADYEAMLDKIEIIQDVRRSARTRALGPCRGRGPSAGTLVLLPVPRGR